MYAHVYIIFQASMLEYDAGTYSSTLGAANAIDTCVCVCVCVCAFFFILPTTQSVNNFKQEIQRTKSQKCVFVFPKKHTQNKWERSLRSMR